MAVSAFIASRWGALTIALILGAFVALSQNGAGPSRRELGQALSDQTGRPILPADLRALSCQDAGAQGYACRWQQREDHSWRESRGYLRPDATGWRTIQSEGD